MSPLWWCILRLNYSNFRRVFNNFLVWSSYVQTSEDVSHIQFCLFSLLYSFPDFFQSLIFNGFSNPIDSSLHFSSLLWTPMIVDNTLHLVNVIRLHSVSMLLMVNLNFGLRSKISNVRANIRCFNHMPTLSLIQLILNHTFLFFLSWLNNPLWLGRLNSSFNVVNDLSSYIVGKERLFVNSLVGEQFIKFCLSLSIPISSSIVQILVDSHRSREKSTCFVNARLGQVDLLMSLIDPFRFHK